MQEKFVRLRATLDEFARQDDYPMLVLGCGSLELIYVVKAFEALDQTLPSHLILPFHHAFREPHQWLDGLVELTRVQLESLDANLAAADKPPTSPLPMAALDSRTPAPERLRALLTHLAALLPNQHEYRVVVGLLPLECDELSAFAELIAGVLPITGPSGPELPAGVRALRLLVWDDLEAKVLSDAIYQTKAPHILRYADDFSTPALVDAIGRRAADRSLALSERMSALLQLAALDFSHRRYAAAIEKYGVLHEYYAQQGQPDLQAMTLLGAGDTLIGAGQLEPGKLRLQQGVAVAMECKSLGVLSVLLRSLTSVCASLGQHAEAESYADSGARVAAATLTPGAYIDMLDRRGDAELAQAKYEQAMASYTKCRGLCRELDDHERWISILDKQAEFYARARMEEEHRALMDERAEARAREVESSQHGVSA